MTIIDEQSNEPDFGRLGLPPITTYAEATNVSATILHLFEE
jgi:hypothetical protein